MAYRHSTRQALRVCHLCAGHTYNMFTECPAAWEIKLNPITCYVELISSLSKAIINSTL